MIFLFPDLDSLRIALTSGMVPPAVSREPAEVSFGSDGKVAVNPQSSPTKSMQSALKRIGVGINKDHVGDVFKVESWPEIIPLSKESSVPELSSNSAVLFDMPVARLADLAGEMLRLGNDRQSFQSFKTNDEERVLLRVIGPPYYTLLRALDHLDPDVSAFIEQSPRVWVEIGWQHSLANILKMPEGQLLLLRPPRRWMRIEDGPYHDIYDILTFELPNSSVEYAEGRLKDKLSVPLRLAAGNAADLPELWVINENAVETFDAFVREADERVMGRLTFAVTADDMDPTIVIQVRPSKLAPPSLDLPGAVGFAAYRRIRNLYVPAGTRLQPTLRRDAVRQMLANDDAQVVWLTPLGEGRFTPESMPDEAFRPLADWVEYIIDRERQTLRDWVQATTFDFDSFVCTGELPTEPPPPPYTGKGKSRKTKIDGSVESDEATDDGPESPKVRKRSSTRSNDLETYSTPIAIAPPSELKTKRDELEKTFLAIEGSIDEPERIALWPQLARLNGGLQDSAEAAVCWANALWNREDLPPEWLSVWHHSEANETAPEINAVEIDRTLANLTPSQADVRRFATRVLHACSRKPIPAVLNAKLPGLRRYFEQHDALLGVRVTWLVWLHLTKLSGDALGLARVRDRLIERLFKHGLQPRYDVPNFIRYAGQRDSDRLRRVQELLAHFRAEVGEWLSAQDKTKDPTHHLHTTTGRYADLIFAFGFAKIGDDRRCTDLLGDTLASLRRKKEGAKQADPVHQVLSGAFEYRIVERLRGPSSEAAFPANIIESFKNLEKDYIPTVAKIRQHSRILEPLEKTEQYLGHSGQDPQKLNHALVTLRQIADPRLLEQEIKRTIRNNGAPLDPSDLQKMLREVLFLSTRIGEPFARELLDQAFQSLTPPRSFSSGDSHWMERIERHARLADAAIWTAGAFGLVDHIQAFLIRFVQNLQKLDEDSIMPSIKYGLGNWVRFMRKFGLRDQVESLLRQLTDLLLRGRTVDKLRIEYGKDARRAHWMDMLLSLLQLAEYWIYFGWEKQALPYIEEAKNFIAAQKDRDPKKQPVSPFIYGKLVCAYIRCVSQMNEIDDVASTLSELFRNMAVIPNTSTSKQYFSVIHLDIVENLVLALVNDDFILGETARRWLDDDEYLVRRRINVDLKKMMGGIA